MSERLIYIYALRDPVDRRIRYVGKTANPRKRLVSHRGCNRSVNKAMTEWLLDVKRGYRVRFNPLMEVLESVPESVAPEREIYWIGKLSRAGGDLLNVRGVESRRKSVVLLGELTEDDVSTLVKWRGWERAS